MRALTLISVLAITGCSGDDESPYTWGDAVDQISVDYCEMVARCGYNTPPTCAEHTKFHLCTEHNTCDLKLADGCEQAVEDCSAAIDAVVDPYSRECSLVFWGLIPSACSPAFDCQPERGPNDH